jgi:hypothetical protein
MLIPVVIIDANISEFPVVQLFSSKNLKLNSIVNECRSGWVSLIQVILIHNSSFKIFEKISSIKIKLT